ncbi:MAG: hypothetical protein U1E65_27770 [Myxococcota bacterium]
MRRAEAPALLLWCALFFGCAPGVGAVDAGAARPDLGMAELDAEQRFEPDADPEDAVTDLPDAPAPQDAQEDAGIPLADAMSGEDASAPDAAAHYGWARYTIAAGAHTATIDRNGAAQLPRSGFMSGGARVYDFIFDRSAMYVLTNPTEPDDQLDWNKLPGLSDCGQLDLAQDGLMFAWRWRPDRVPPVLEIAQYANNGGTHLYPAEGLVTLEESELAEETPLHYALEIAETEYRFHLTGTLARGPIDESARFPRRCTTSTTALKWAGGFYFGGTSTAPHRISGFVQE